MIFELPSDKPGRTKFVGWRIAAVLTLSGMMLAGIGVAFWQEGARYALPEAPPEDWRPVAPGTIVRHPSLTRTRKATLLHFHSEQCPCSRYAIDHLRELSRRFQHEVEVVTVTIDGEADFPWVARKFVDRDGTLAKALGVYATPQAALLDENGRLLFRGSYNRSRFCADPETQYVRMAIEDHLAKRSARPRPGSEKAFGCALRKKNVS